MIKKILNNLSNNLLLKIVSVVIAIFIWYIVVNINDPIETTNFTVRITVENESYIANGKTSYRIDDANKTVVVYVKGNRSRLKNITADDIQVTADLTQIVDLERDPVMVPLSATCTGISASNLTLAKSTIPITIETISSKEFPVTVDTGDSSPGNNYEVGTVTANPDTIIINGPESVVSTIDTVIASIDVTGMTQDGTKKANLTIIDKNSEELSQETIEDDLTFDGDISELSVYVDLWKKRSDISFEVEYSGTPATGYSVTAITTTPETVTVVGNEDALSELTAEGNKITIPSSEISVEGIKADMDTDVLIADILPEGLRLAQTSADTVSVHITVLSDETKEMSIDVDDIVAENLASDLSISYDQAELTLRITGIGTKLDTLTTDDIEASIDLSDMEEGDYTVTLAVTLPSGVSLDGSAPTISIHLKERAEPSAQATGTGA